MDLEIVLQSAHLDYLNQTSEQDRGYLTVEQQGDILVAKELHPGTPGQNIIDPADVQEMFAHALHDSGAVIPYINTPHKKSVQVDASEFLKIQERTGIYKALAYGVINGKIAFFRVEKTSFGATFKNVPFRLRDDTQDSAE